jgi:hypothetical protein
MVGEVRWTLSAAKDRQTSRLKCKVGVNQLRLQRDILDSSLKITPKNV